MYQLLLAHALTNTLSQVYGIETGIVCTGSTELDVYPNKLVIISANMNDVSVK